MVLELPVTTFTETVGAGRQYAFVNIQSSLNNDDGLKNLRQAINYEDVVRT